MHAFNIVRFRVKPGFEEEFVARHRNAGRDMPGFRRGMLVKTGDASFCFVGEWRSMAHIVAARPQMIGILDGFRHMLEDLGGDLGITDPVSGEAVVEIAAPAPVKRKPAKKARAKKRVAARGGRRPAKKK